MKKLSLLSLSLLALATASAASRESIDFCAEWNFCKGEPTEASVMEKVTIPHSWNAADGTTKDYYRGAGTYTKRFDLDRNVKDSRVFLRFEAASLKAEAWLNGVRLGDHRGAFNAFIFDITDIVKKKGNELIVKVDNSHDMDIIPLEGDFTVFGGIYRPVSLLITPKECITPMDYASSGAYITPISIDKSRSSVAVDVLVEGNADYALRTSVIDKYGKTVASSESSAMTKRHGFKALTDTIVVENPNLWDGLKNPELYTFRFDLLKNGKKIDSVDETYGFRTIEVDVRNGLSLNGRPYNIRGVNRHQDRPGQGWAITEENHKEDIALIKEIGANGIRLAHYPHSDFFYSLCDKEGLLVWAEIPFIGKGTLESDSFNENLDTQLIELIRQNYNHPAIFCWSLFNELGGERNYGPVITHLHELAHAEDPSRLTTAAPNNEGRPENFVTDIVAYNVYPGWYWAQPETMAYAIDWKYKPENNQPLAISEYGAGANIYQHAIIPSAPKTDGQFHPEEWQATCHEGNYREICKRDFLWGTFVWNMFDFASGGRNEGAQPGMNDKGLVTYDRKHRKDAFWFYKANWNKEEPVVHIASKRWNLRSSDKGDIKVYSNCPDVTLKVNGKAVGVPSCELNTYIWKDVEFRKGENLIEASATFNGEPVNDSFVLTIN